MIHRPVTNIDHDYCCQDVSIYISIYVCMFVRKIYSCGWSAGRTRLKIAYTAACRSQAGWHTDSVTSKCHVLYLPRIMRVSRNVSFHYNVSSVVKMRFRRWHYSAAHWHLGDVVVGNVTFLWFLLFSVCYSLHVAVTICINCSFFLHLWSIQAKWDSYYISYWILHAKRPYWVHSPLRTW